MRPPGAKTGMIVDGNIRQDRFRLVLLELLLLLINSCCNDKRPMLYSYSCSV